VNVRSAALIAGALLLAVPAQGQTRRERSEALDRLEVELLHIDEELRAASVRVREQDGRLAELEADLADAEARLEERRGRLELRLRAMYRMRHRGFLPLLFAAESPHELLRSARYLWWIVRADQAAIDAWRTEEEVVADLRGGVEAQRASLLQWAGEQSLRREQALAERDVHEAAGGRVRSPTDRRRMSTVILPDGPSSPTVDVSLDLRGEEPPSGLATETVKPQTTFERSMGMLPLPAVGTVTRASRGVDIDMAASSPIRAVHGGVVSKVVEIDGFGLVCLLDHGDGWSTVYGRAEGFDVRGGQQVASGDVIGRSGPDGMHFGVRRGRDAADPFEWLAIPPGVRVRGK